MGFSVWNLHTSDGRYKIMIRGLEESMAYKHLILRALAGNVIGSSYEFDNVKTLDFDLFQKGTFFTDDSVLTAETAIQLHALPGDCRSFL